MKLIFSARGWVRCRFLECIPLDGWTFRAQQGLRSAQISRVRPAGGLVVSVRAATVQGCNNSAAAAVRPQG